MDKEIELLLRVENYMKLHGWIQHEWSVAEDEERHGLIFQLPNTQLFVGFNSHYDETTNVGDVMAQFVLDNKRFGAAYRDSGGPSELIDKIVESVVEMSKTNPACADDKLSLERIFTKKAENDDE